MNRRGCQLWVIAVLLVIVGTCIFLVTYFSDPIKIVFRNESDALLRKVEIRYVGGSHFQRMVLPGSTFAFTMSVVDESSVQVTVLRDDQEITQDVGIYLEPCYRGRILIRFTPHSQIRSSIRIIPWPIDAATVRARQEMAEDLGLRVSKHKGSNQ